MPYLSIATITHKKHNKLSATEVLGYGVGRMLTGANHLGFRERGGDKVRMCGFDALRRKGRAALLVI